MDTRDQVDSRGNYPTRPVRVGIMNTQDTIQEWQARCLNNLVALDKTQVVLFIGADENRRTRAPYKKQTQLTRALFPLCLEWFLRPSSTRIRDTGTVLVDLPFIRCKPVKDMRSLSFTEEDVETISAYNLDVILWLGSSMIRGTILNVPRYGVWSFSHCIAGKPAGLPCFWEMYSDECSVGAMLLRLTGQDDWGIVLRRGLLRVPQYSYAQSVDEILFEIARWPARVCADILQGNDRYVNDRPSPIEPPVRHVPGYFQVLRFLAKLVKNRFIGIYKSFFCYDQWNIGIAYEPIHAFLRSTPKVHYLPLPDKRTFLADPFGIVRDKKLTILCEQFSYASCKGRISRVELLDGNLSYQAIPALSLPIHVSYPYLIEYEGEVYCIPETAAAREIALYKSEEFPHKWAKVTTLITDVAAIDATVFRYKDYWWLMCTDKEQNAFVNLFAWYAQDLFGRWKPHEANPIKTDVHSARSAGTPFEHDGCLYRPAQDCSRTYGGRIVINKVTCLTPRDFREEQVAIVEPCAGTPFPDGVHTISSAGDFTLIDGKRVVFVGSAFKHKLLRRLRRMLAFQQSGNNTKCSPLSA